MKTRFMKILIIYVINITLSIAVRYDCDMRNVSCGCAFKNVEINEENNHPEEAIPYSWSMIVSIRYDCHRNGNSSTHCCSGTILNNRYILTTARCFVMTENSPLLSDNVTIASSIHNLSQDCQMIRDVDDIFIHPNWTASNEALHNIAILHLTEPLDLKKDVILSQTCLPSRMNTSDEIMSNTTLAVVGWGEFSNSQGKTDQVLQQLSIYPIDYSDSLCSRAIDDKKFLFCAGRYGAACFTEVGGSVFQWIGNRWELVGIESYAMDGCPRVGYKGLFIRISAYDDWIKSVISSDNIITSSQESTTTESNSTTSVQPPLSYECNGKMSCGCGYSDVMFRSTRIIGGEDAVEHSWSMMVSLRFYGSEENYCAGTLLSSSYVLTAAHCVDFFSSTHPINITVVAGVTNRSGSESYQRKVDRIYIHENYTGWPPLLNNIALLHMERPLYFQHNPVLAKTCVQYVNSSESVTKQHPKNGTRLVVIGWGATRPGSFVLSEYLKQIRIPAIDDEDEICKKTVANSDLQFCAGFYSGEKDACLGDSGGPVLYWTGQYWEQLGIIGNNNNCGRAGYPGIYTRLSYYWQWMEDILSNTNEHLEPHYSLTLSTTTTVSTSRSTVPFTTRMPLTSTSSDAMPSSTTTSVDGTQTMTSSNASLSSIITFSDVPSPTTSSSTLLLTTSTNTDISRTTTSSNIYVSPTTTSVDIEQTTTSSNTFPSSTISVSDILPLTISSSTLLLSTSTNTGVSQTTTLSSILISPTTTSTNILQTTTSSNTFLSSTVTVSDVPQLTTASNTQLLSTSTNTGAPQTMTASTILVSLTSTSSDMLQTTTVSGISVSPTTTNTDVGQTTTSSNILASSTTTNSDTTQTITSSNTYLSSSTISISDVPQLTTSSNTILLTTSTDANLSQKTTTSNTLVSSTITSPDMSQTTTSSGTFPPSTITVSDVPQLTTSSNTLLHSTSTNTNAPQTTTSSNILVPLTTTSSDMSQTTTLSTAKTTTYMDVAQSTTSSNTFLQSTSTNRNTPQTTTSCSTGASSSSTASNIPITTSFSTASLKPTTSSDIVQTVTPSNTWTALTSTTSSNVSRTTISASILTTTTVSSLPTNITRTTDLPPRSITYQCNRIPNECGCSFSNVVLFHDNPHMPSVNSIGESAFPYSWSMIVSIRVNGTKHTCSGTILSELFILTTAQCVANHIRNHKITVAAGIHSLSQYITSIHTVAEVYIHENYTNSPAHWHDIAILRLGHSLELKTQPVLSKTCLHNIRFFSSIGTSDIVSVGWKDLPVKETSPDTLQQVPVKPITNSDSTCFNSTYNNKYQFCAGSTIDDKDTCQENLAEPLFVYRNDYWEQVGILSKTFGCTPIGHSGVYVRLSAYTDWIQRIMQHTPIPMRQPVNKNSASQLKQNILIFNILLVTFQIFS